MEQKEEMNKKLIKLFVGKKVKLEINTIGTPFFLYGVIQEIDNEIILFKTDRLGTIRISDIVAITESD